ncbi:MAG: histidine ammonia-lyase [Lewinella sp.]|uniref:histidine ammonia-lyase n=1 Tax=Lewinella sp. TaxID=2004506 RepID=UPI003D6B6C3F
MFHYGKDVLTAGKALAIARGKLSATLAADTRSQVAASQRIVEHVVEQGAAVYGINTGFGPLCNQTISKEDTAILQKKLLLSHSVGVGKPIDREVAKLMLILKIHALSQGYSGIALGVLDRLLWQLEEDIIPVVPEQGSVGASGDLAPLSHLFLPLLGEGEVFYQGSRYPTNEILAKYNKEALILGPKAGLALINGTQFIAAHAVLLVERFHNCLVHADLIAALMVEGLQGSDSPFDPKLHQVRPYPGTVHVAQRMKNFLSDSAIMADHENCDRVQDPYSLRCVPQVHGASRQAWLHLKETVEIEINAVTDNPIVFSEEEVISGGNFHGQPLALPLDYACLALSELGNISDRRSYLSLEGKSPGVPKLLLTETGVNSGFMIVQYTSAALASENKTLCFPASADSIPTSLGQEDHVSMGSIGARKALRVCGNVEKILAVEMLCAAQAVDFQRPLTSSPVLEAAHTAIRQQIPFATEDRIFAKDINAALGILQRGDLLAATAPYITPNAFTYTSLLEEF